MPQSMTTIVSPYSIAVIFIPILSSPPRGMILTFSIPFFLVFKFSSCFYLFFDFRIFQQFLKHLENTVKFFLVIHDDIIRLDIRIGGHIL